ncbi:hypothetical protein FQA39_LY09387 [Lamprigera yunnana]|nr:hypothetical protein FQA39_LY09387 [Lamprigera yunnana]
MNDSTSELFVSKRKRVRKWWEQLSYLERNLITSVMVLGSILFLILLILIILSAASPKICKTANCIIAAAEIVSRTNPTINPCDDFYQFTCEKLNEPSHKKTQLTVEQIEDQLIDILTLPVTEEDPHELKQQKELFQMCLSKTEGDTSLEILKNTFLELHGWPVTLGYDWKAGFFDWKSTITHLRRKGLPHNLLLSLTLTPEQDNNNKLILNIGHPEVTKVQYEHRYDYRKLMSEVAIVFGADRSRAVNDMKRVLDFILEFGKLTETKAATMRIKISDIQTYFGEINWLEFINEILEPSTTILADDYVMAPNHKFLQELLSLISRTPKRVQANYIMWRIVEEFLPFLSERLKNLQSNYAYMTNSVTLAPERWHLQQCNDIISKSFITPPSEKVYADQHLGIEKTNQIIEMGINIKTSFTMFLKESTWITEKAKQDALKRVENLKIIAGFHSNFANSNVEKLGNSSFFDSLFNNIKAKTDTNYAQIHSEVTHSRFFYESTYTTEVLYILQSNALILPVGTYFEDTPVYLNYGEMGVIISQKLTSAVLTEYEELWTDDAEQASKCTSHGNHTSDLNQLLDMIGVLVTHAAYQIWNDYHAEEEYLIGLHYNPNQLLWISSFLGYCSKHNDKRASVVNVIAETHPNFAKDFDCPWGSPMNPLTKCKII